MGHVYHLLHFMSGTSRLDPTVSIEAALTDALTDRRTTRRTSEAARAHVDTAYSWPVLAERVHDVYADVQRR